MTDKDTLYSAILQSQANASEHHLDMVSLINSIKQAGWKSPTEIKEMNKYITNLQTQNHILAIYNVELEEQLAHARDGYVQLAADQIFPVPSTKKLSIYERWLELQKAGWRKVQQ